MKKTAVDLNKFKKALVIGDVHGRYEPWRKAYDYAIQNNYLFVMLGDLVDVNDGAPQIFSDLANSPENWILTIGNHEDKISRYIIGNPVKLSNGNRITVEQLETVPGFRDNYMSVLENAEHGRVAFHYMFHSFIERSAMSLVFTHGAVHRDVWTRSFDVSYRRHREMAMYGETNGETYEHNGRAFPVRTYSWVDKVPKNARVFVGHDTRAFLPLPTTEDHCPRSEPYMHTGNLGGQVWFMDTGCGKNGVLSGAVVNFGTCEVEQILNFGA
jgi:hypothetical protein